MKTLRFAIAAAAVVGSVSAFATNARVESMGKNSTFIMDDISIFDNPANINLYPNFLIGELGNYITLTDSVTQGQNRDPLDPWFGGIFSLKISADNSLSIAGVLNRKDDRLLKFLPNRIITVDYPEGEVAPVPATNFDGFLGANIGNKAFGAHVYLAHQDGLNGENKISPDAFVSVLQVDLGTNIEISNDYSIEVAIGSARMQYGPRDRKLFDPDLLSYFGNVRLFSRINAINGHLIPVASFRNMVAPGRDELEAGLGMGVDAAFDRGFFWMGLKGFYNNQRAGSSWRVIDDITKTRTETIFTDDITNDLWGEGKIARLWQFGGTISFGIEKNIWWDWFVLRVGGQKTIAYADYKAGVEPRSILCPSKAESGCKRDGNYFITNATSDGTKDDNVGFGIGINVEEKLKIDATIAEDVVFRNPFQGEGRLISRISATYSF